MVAASDEGSGKLVWSGVSRRRWAYAASALAFLVLGSLAALHFDGWRDELERIRPHSVASFIFYR